MGQVYLVGAGPGDVGLYTLRAKEVIEQADVIIYDYLANEAFREWVKEGCEIIYAGKQGGHHTMSQEEINALLVKKAREHEVVVRLKGGDPYIFGRGGEEAQYLKKHSVEFEVIPGVSSAYAAPAYAGIPLTHREYASSVTFITGHEAREKQESSLDWRALALSASTLVFFMGVKNLPLITERLIQAGMSPTTPAALIMWGTTCRQKSISSTLEGIVEDARKAHMAPPALLVIGRVVELKEELNFFEHRPLLGKRVVITRARHQASELSLLLQKKGACVIEFPTIKIVPIEENKPLERAIERIGEYDWIIFTSVNGVDCFFSNLHGLKKDSRALGGCKVCAIGPATARRLKSFGIIPDFMPERYVAEEIISGLKERSIEGTSVLIPRAAQAREILPKRLREMGCNVEVVALYRTLLEEKDSGRIIELIKGEEVHYITFTSSSTVKNFFKLVPVELIREKFQHTGLRLVAIGPITASTLEEFGCRAHIIPSSYTIASLVRAIEEDTRGGSPLRP